MGRAFPPGFEGGSHTVVVRPIDGGWCVASTINDQALVFFSGRVAEANARRLALTIANSGVDANVIVHDRRNVQIGTVHYYGCEGIDETVPHTPT